MNQYDDYDNDVDDDDDNYVDDVGDDVGDDDDHWGTKLDICGREVEVAAGRSEFMGSRSPRNANLPQISYLENI